VEEEGDDDDDDDDDGDDDVFGSNPSQSRWRALG
jgi:hypothetical protein